MANELGRAALGMLEAAVQAKQQGMPGQQLTFDALSLNASQEEINQWEWLRAQGLVAASRGTTSGNTVVLTERGTQALGGGISWVLANPFIEA